jgi:molybdate transport system ATP-binding protein
MEENNYTFKLTGVVPNAPYAFKEPLNLEMKKGEQWIIYGANGSGKSFLVKVISSAFTLRQGQIRYNFNQDGGNKVSDNMRFVTFHDQYGDNADATFYQLRWNQGLIGDETPTVEKVLRQTWNEDGEMPIGELGIGDLLKKKTIMLSSGEFRRFQIAKILLHRPRVLVLDNPFIGLDEQNRKQVANFLNKLIRQGGMQLIMVLSRWPQDVSAITHVVEVSQGSVRKYPIAEYHPQSDTTTEAETEKQRIEALMKRLPAPVNAIDGDFEQVLKLNDVSIAYDERTILKNLNWEIERGQKWALQGQNGAGKSTLLSLVCADNPQSYACDITLFGHQRGTGESIWDIKHHIGYVSPEMFRTYRKPMPVKNIVASGLFDTVGLFRQPKAEDFDRIDVWLDIFGILGLKEKNYMHLSGGEQRLALLARAFVKDPDLLILDEPFHGLDSANRQRAKVAIECFCDRPGKTMIMVSHYKEDFPACITHYLTLQKH